MQWLDIDILDKVEVSLVYTKSGEGENRKSGKSE